MGKQDAIRAFIAIDFDAAARHALADVLSDLRARPGGEAMRWLRPEALHVTLRFLGDVAPESVEAIARAVGGEVAPLAPFALTLGAAFLFPSPRRPRVVALEVAPAEPLGRLAAAVERGVTAAGLPPEPRPFRAHLTLGRTDGRRPPEMAGAAAPAGTAVSVDAVVLFRSELRPGGARHTPLERMPLAGVAPGATDHP